MVTRWPTRPLSDLSDTCRAAWELRPRRQLVTSALRNNRNTAVNMWLNVSATDGAIFRSLIDRGKTVGWTDYWFTQVIWDDGCCLLLLDHSSASPYSVKYLVLFRIIICYLERVRMNISQPLSFHLLDDNFYKLIMCLNNYNIRFYH